MPAFATIEQLKDLLYGFEVDEETSPEVSSSTLQSRLNLEAAKITGEWNLLYNRTKKNPPPLPPEDPTKATIINLILELLNLEVVAADILRTKVAAQDFVFYGQAKVFYNIAKQRRQRFASGGLNTAILQYLRGVEFETTSFINEIEIARDTPGFTITEHTQPSISTALRIAARESAWIRALAILNGYKHTIATLSSLQLEGYQSLVLGMAAPQIQRIKFSPKYIPEIDAIIVNGLSAGWKAIYGEPGIPGFANGAMRSIFQ